MQITVKDEELIILVDNVAKEIYKQITDEEWEDANG